MTDTVSRPNLPLWQRIHDALSDEIDCGRYPAGAKLPTEAELSHRFGVNRHTVRRALERLRIDGRIYVRRGSGAFVTQGRFDYAIGPRTRMSRNLSEHGRHPTRDWLQIETAPAGRAEAQALEIDEGAPVVVSEVVARADDTPISYATSTFPAERIPGIEAALGKEGSVTGALAAVGIADYRRLWTKLTAERPGVMIARHLQMPEVHPVLLAVALNIDPDGRPIEYGRTWFCSDRVQLVVDSASFAPDAGELSAADRARGSQEATA